MESLKKPKNYLRRAIRASELLIISMCLFACVKEQAESVREVEPVFKRIPSEVSGVTFQNNLEESVETFFDYFTYVYNGGGVGIGDINNDGLSDIYFTGNQVSNKLYLNLGNMKFKDITTSAGVEGGLGWNNGVSMVDVNLDGFLDIYVCRGGWQDTDEQRRNLLFINQGDLTFKEQSVEFGLDEKGYSIHASFFDMDNDNDLDVYITSRPDSFDLPLTQMVKQKKLSPKHSRDKLYLNEKGKFKEIGLQAGITNNYGYALSVVTADVNNDGFIDIFVANDFAESDYLYINQGDGTFKEKIKQATNHVSMYSMGTDIADINNDGLEDIFVSEMLPEDYKRSKVSMPSMDVEGFYAIVNSGMHKQYMHNALHLNQGNLFFSDISQLAGVAKTEWSWSSLLADFDNDGYKDIFVANGYKRDVFDGDVQDKLTNFIRNNKHKYSSPQDMLDRGFKEFIDVYDPIKVKNYLFRNKGNLEFDNVSETWGFNEVSFSNGAAIADLDNDGDLDLVVNNIDGEAFLYDNTSSSRNSYLRIELIGPAGNADGLGAKVTLYYDGNIQYFENKIVRGYLSSCEPVVHFGVGNTQRVDSIRVRWPDGRGNLIKDEAVNQVLQVKYAESKLESFEKPNEKSLFIETTEELLPSPFIHRENVFNEYSEQILLPHMFSRSGPFIAVGDVNNDGAEDFYVGGAAGQAGSLFIQRDGKMVRTSKSVFDADKAYEDMGTVFFDANNDGSLDLYVVSGGSEFPEGSELYQDRLYVNDGKGNFKRKEIPKTVSSGSCVVVSDINGDGYKDLFRGGQVVANSYPKAPRSYLLINDNGNFVDKTMDISPPLSEIGMVNSAAWVDLNGDNSSELVVVGEWMPITVFEFRNGKLEDISGDLGLQNTQGWWNKVIANDIDDDGDMDLLLGNLGENYKFKASVEKPFEVFAKDFDYNGTNDIFLARYYQNTMVPIRGRECSSQQMPVIAQKFPTYLSFAESDLRTILGADIEQAIHREAYLFSSVILINEGGTLRLKKLPVETQLSTVNCIAVEDFDKDGKKDILLAGNKFDVEVETTAADASPGVFLNGTGGLEFKSLKPMESGFFVPYNVKDMQLIKIKDEWTAIVSINNEGLRMFSTATNSVVGFGTGK
ncbi:MAG: VCBS repeat-containing protein [Cyclobacteriaceae bacterium]|nr:VCBS repeat-containing protein [Cyclobacteriaceae bacterium SS2]